jgi:hypothetical protein
VQEAFTGQQMELIETNISTEEEARRREVFADA